MSDATSNPLKRAGETPVETAIPEPKKPKSNDHNDTEMDVEDDEEDDAMAGLDQSNIISGARTRGKQIDFTKADAELGADEDDEEDDEDVVLGDETMEVEDEEEDSPDEDEDEEAEAEA